MKRDEAVTFLKEISTLCSNLSPDSVALVYSEQDDPLSTGFQVHIGRILDKEDLERIESVVTKHCLALKGGNDKIVIYQPKVTAIK